MEITRSKVNKEVCTVLGVVMVAWKTKLGEGLWNVEGEGVRMRGCSFR